jgi:hypothetical protein
MGPATPRPGTIGDRVRRADEALVDLRDGTTRRGSPAAVASVLRTGWHLVVHELEHLPGRIDRWLLTVHRPIDVAGDGSVAHCRICRVRWPCSEFVEINDRITERETAPSS